MSKYTLFLFLSLYSVLLDAQNPHCGQAAAEAFLQQKYPELYKEIATYKETIPFLENSSTLNARTGNVLLVPVVVHVVHQGQAIGGNQNLSEARILQQLQILNQDYRRLNSDASATPASFEGQATDTNIEFCLATIDPSGNPTTGITRHQYNNVPEINFIEEVIKPNTNWNPDRYLNIWSVPMPSPEIVGYAYLPSNSIVGSDLDGVVIANHRFGVVSSSRGRTATHELGHYLGVQHPWGSDESCSNDDGISDTPNSDGPYYGCPSHPRNSCNSVDMFMNFMDYVDDACMNVFTTGQANVMRQILSTKRAALLQHANTACGLDVATQEIKQANDLKIYPKPAHDLLYVALKTSSNEKLLKIEIFNQAGQLLLMDKCYDEGTHEIDVATLASGLYFMKIQTTTGIFQDRIIVY